MRSPASHVAVALLFMLTPLGASAATDFWTYSYKNIDVTAQGNGTFTVNLARYCARLDALLVQILGIKTDYRVPTRIYALPAAEIRRLTGGDYSNAYLTSHWTNTVLMDSGALPDGRPYWGAFFGYTGSLLASDQQGGPDWYRVGVPEVFADTLFEKGQARIGNITPAFALTLTTGGALYPMRAFLAMTQTEAHKQGEHQAQIYDAEAWYVARLVFVEGWHRAEFGRYLDLMRQGQSEAAAYSTTFKVSYEDLDHELARAMRERAHIYILPAPADPEAAQANAQPLTLAEWRGRLAGVYALYEHPEAAQQMAQEALRLEPDNQDALRALARAQLDAHAYGEALATTERIRVDGQPALASLERAAVWAELARAVVSGAAHLPVDAASLRKRARADYERALSADPDNREARGAIAALEAAG